MKYDTAQPYIASYVIIRNEEGEVAFVLRSNTEWMNNYYGLPSGKVEKDESSSAGAIREALEEIGITVTSEGLRHTLTVHRHEKGDYGNTWVDVYFEVNTYEGKPYNAEPDKHSDLVWLNPSDLPENVIPSVRAAFGFIAEGRQFAEWGWAK